jgi:hypothetical protein
MPEHKKSGWKVRIFTLINSEIASQNAKISSTLETDDMSDILFYRHYIYDVYQLTGTRTVLPALF